MRLMSPVSFKLFFDTFEEFRGTVLNKFNLLASFRLACARNVVPIKCSGGLDRFYPSLLLDHYCVCTC